MTRVKTLRESIRRELEAGTGIRFYSEFAPAWAKVPYGVYSLMLLSRGESQETWDLMVNIADSGQSEERVEELAEAAAGQMDYLDYFGEDGISWTCYLNTVTSIDHGDTTIYQRRLSFNLRVAKGE